jgi:hypothetical protein
MTPSKLPNTIAAELLQFPYIVKTSMNAVPCKSVATAIKAAQNDSMTTVGELPGKVALVHCATPTPEECALEFYLLNHAVTLIRAEVHELEDLGPLVNIVREYKRGLAAHSARMMYYLTLICTRESRHDDRDHYSSGYMAQAVQFGEQITTFHRGLKGSGSGGAASRFKDAPPAAEFGPYTAFLSQVFYKGAYSSGYGGKAWGKIADVLAGAVSGDLSAEMMLDTAFTLAHNNGPIFNKGMFYAQHSHHLPRILDVQRSGQIPQLIASEPTITGATSRVKALHAMCVSTFEKVGMKGSLDGPVDWYQVEALGSLKKYPSEKASQDKAGGKKHIQNQNQAPSKFKLPVVEDSPAGTFIKYVEVYPGSKIKKVSR